MELYVYPIVALLFVGLFTREVIAPASRNACDRRWMILALASAGGTFVATILVGVVFASVIRDAALIPAAARLPWPVVGLLGFVLASFVGYWWHRLEHRANVVWRVFHQLHHSAPRVESLTAFYMHPLDGAAAMLLNLFTCYVVLGASPQAAALSVLLTSVFDLFIHADVHTPRWLGYFVQRPEMHSVHHARGHHAQNYGLPVWDLLFGTWANPVERVGRVGFDDAKSERIYDMLRCRDVHTS